MFSLAHLSDVHLGPLPPGAAFRNFRLKRIVGSLSWQLRRHKLYDVAAANLIAADIRQMAPDHVVLTGDLVNVSAYAEFPRAANWMAALGDTNWLTFVPGNHDTYVFCPWHDGLAHLAPWMTGDMRLNETQTSEMINTPFPFVRLRKNIAIISLSSALPQYLHCAGGRLGPVQLQSLQVLLNDLRERGYARVVLIHHPPLPALAPPRKALDDAALLRDVLQREGAELVLHGHNHRSMLNSVRTQFGICNVLGVPSASMTATQGHTPAAWNLYRIIRQDGRWLTQVTVRSFDPDSRTIKTTSEFSLSS